MDSDNLDPDTSTGSTQKDVKDAPTTNAATDHKEEEVHQDANARPEREAAFSDYIVCRVC